LHSLLRTEVIATFVWVMIESGTGVEEFLETKAVIA
jgi:hypothetical protein